MKKLQLTDAQAVCPSQTKVGQFEDTLFRDKDVGCLHVTVENLVAMNVVEAIHQLLHHLFDLPQGEGHAHVAQQSRQVVLTELEDQVKCALVSVVLRC